MKAIHLNAQSRGQSQCDQARFFDVVLPRHDVLDQPANSAEQPDAGPITLGGDLPWVGSQTDRDHRE